MSKKDSKILFLDDDGQEIEFNVIEQTTIAGQTYLLVEDLSLIHISEPTRPY